GTSLSVGVSTTAWSLPWLASKPRPHSRPFSIAFPTPHSPYQPKSCASLRTFSSMDTSSFPSGSPARSRPSSGHAETDAPCAHGVRGALAPTAVRSGAPQNEKDGHAPGPAYGGGPDSVQDADRVAGVAGRCGHDAPDLRTLDQLTCAGRIARIL